MVGKVTKNAMCKNYSKIRRCDKSSGAEYNLLMFNFRVYIYIRSCFAFVDHSIVLTVTGFCHEQFVKSSYTVRVNGLERVEMMCCHKKKLDGCVIVDAILRY